MGNQSDTKPYNRKSLIADLQNRSVQLFVTLASIGDAVITTDGINSITFLNPAAEKITGWTLEEAVGLDIEDTFTLVNETTGEPIPSTIQKAIQTGSKVILPQDAVLVRRDGTTVPIDDSAAPIIDMEGNVLGAVLVFRDITEKKQADSFLKYLAELDRLVARVSTAFMTSPIAEVDAVINNTLHEIGEFFKADRANIFLLSNDETTITCSHEWHADDFNPMIGLNVPVSSVPNWMEAIRHRQNLRICSIDDIPADASVEKKIWIDNKMCSLISVPMLREDKVVGSLSISSTESDKEWQDRVADVLYLIGGVTAGALDRSEALKKLAAAREREVELGAKIQEALLLSKPPDYFEGFRIAALTIPSKTVDGDFYDFLQHPNGSLDIVFGDVMGKGVPAALLSAGSKTEFLRSLSHLLAISSRGMIPQPDIIVNTVHSVLTPRLSSLDTFVTLTYMRFDPSIKKITLVDCGNTRTMRCSAKDGKIEFLSGYNLPLGFSETEIYSQAEFDYEEDDLFFLYSDGVTEARSPSGELFGIERLSDLICENRYLPPMRLIQVVEDAVIDFTGSRTLLDDFTCVLIKAILDITLESPYISDEHQFTSDMNELAEIRAFVHGFCLRETCSVNTQEERMLELVATEVASNIMRHAYHHKTDQPIWVRIDISKKALRLSFYHRGEPFEGMDKVSMPPLDDAREGGFGLYIINYLMDMISYGVDEKGRQYIELTKKLSSLGG